MAITTTSRVLRLQQAGAEVQGTRGGAVAATRKFYGTGNMTLAQPQFGVQDERGSFFPTYDVIQGLKAAGFTFNGDLRYEDAHWWGNAFMKSASTLSTLYSGGTGTAPNKLPYTWTFKPTANVDDLRSLTWEWGDVGASTRQFQMPYCVGNTFTVSANAATNQAVQLSTQWLGQDRIIMGSGFTTSATAGVADSTRTRQLAKTAKVFVDNAGGTIGTTQFSSAGSGQVVSWYYTVNNGFTPLYYAGNTAAFDDVERTFKTITATMVMRFNATGGSSEYTKWASGAERLVRFQCLGPALDTATYQAGSYATVNFDAMGYWNTLDIRETGSSITISLGLIAVYDSSNASDCQMIVINADNTLATA